jgi:hypothetical protein
LSYFFLPNIDEVIEPIRFLPSMSSDSAQLVEHLDTLLNRLDSLCLVDRGGQLVELWPHSINDTLHHLIDRYALIRSQTLDNGMGVSGYAQVYPDGAPTHFAHITTPVPFVLFLRYT